ncbi:methyltransferase [Zhengella mangrovi]|uniref:Methyltransferase n=1 Tax=Zhengella mangrovi TaxID=1982044 RepID=A0A2G1QPD5_9HYPH|nr:class I SAM-dependent methyltransferase [Zhengella mangrovi]PHP67396.1 methyltransferase [Zhengella mangrovi]
MTALKEKLVRQIGLTGPMSVADYFAACLFDPEHGYYVTREPFGVRGDFTTAPEVSQMFGELVAAWAFSNWQAMGAPDRFVFAEIGPGRGTMMADMLRVLARLQGGAMMAAAHVHLVEASPRLRAVQQDRLRDAPASLTWVERIEDLPALPLIIVGNELFDAIPIRQYVKAGGQWRERMIGLVDGSLAFLAGAIPADPGLLPPDAAGAPDGAIAEIAPQRAALMDTIAAHLAGYGGAGLFPDYGYGQPACGDTLQAVKGHRPDPVLDHPGTADLTAHVDFAALARVAQGHGLAARLADQGDFLLRLGLLERAGSLGAGKSEAQQDAIREAVERLAGPEQMGKLFKVLGIGGKGLLQMA